MRLETISKSMVSWFFFFWNAQPRILQLWFLHCWTSTWWRCSTLAGHWRAGGGKGDSLPARRLFLLQLLQSIISCFALQGGRQAAPPQCCAASMHSVLRLRPIFWKRKLKWSCWRAQRWECSCLHVPSSLPFITIHLLNNRRWKIGHFKWQHGFLNNMLGQLCWKRSKPWRNITAEHLMGLHMLLFFRCNQ